MSAEENTCVDISSLDTMCTMYIVLYDKLFPQCHVLLVRNLTVEITFGIDIFRRTLVGIQEKRSRITLNQGTNYHTDESVVITMKNMN